VPSAIEPVSGGDQSGAVGTALPQPLVVRVVSARGAGVPRVPVTWAVTQGGGTLSTTSTTTDARGETSSVLTLGSAAGSANNVVTATIAAIAGAPVSFTASGAAGPAARLVVAAGDNQSAPAATAVPLTLAARVTDAHGNGVGGTAVNWSVAEGDGVISASTSQSAGDGSVTARWTLGRFAGVQRITVTAPSLTGSPLSFGAYATPNGTIAGVVTLTLPLDPLFAARIASGAAGISTPRSSLQASGTISRAMLAAGRASLTPLTASSAPASQPTLVSNELIVTFRSDALSLPAGATLARSSRATLQTASRALTSRLAAHEASGDVRVAGVSPVVMAARVQVSDPSRLAAVAAALRREPGVARVDPNPIRQLRRTALPLAAATAQPNDLLYPVQAWHHEMVHAPAAWRITHGSAAVLVAVVDDGIRFDHPDIAANLTSDGYDFVSNTLTLAGCLGPTQRAGDGDGYDSDPTIPLTHEYDASAGCFRPAAVGGHGLFVAGILGAVGNNGIGVAGVNWTIRIRPVRVGDTMGGGSDYDVAQGILYAAGLPADDGAGGTVRATSGASVINLSLGITQDVPVVRSAVAAATAAGSLLVAAAGNSASSEREYPAAYDEVVSVSAVGPDGTRAIYSSFGSTIDIAAPGGDVPDPFCDPAIMSTLWKFDTRVPWYACAAGTSAAVPHVVGVAALILAHQPGLSAEQLRSRLTTFATDVGVPGRDDFYGAGIVNARNSVTQTFAPMRRTFVHLYDAQSGAPLDRVAADPAGAFSISALADRDYLVYAGADTDGDQLTGVPGQPWGALGGTPPVSVSVRGAGTYNATFSIGLASEREPNDVVATANPLPIGGHLRGSLATLDEEDMFRVLVPVSGFYTFETSPVAGACGFVMEADTWLQLLAPNGQVIRTSRDIDPAAWNFCARVSIDLSPGVYYLRVFGEWPGRYHVSARSGP
jgi:hypothetical protein